MVQKKFFLPKAVSEIVSQCETPLCTEELVNISGGVAKPSKISLTIEIDFRIEIEVEIDL